MTGDGGLVEVQATAERTPLSRAHLDDLLVLAAQGSRGCGRFRTRRSRRSGLSNALPSRPLRSCSRPATPTSSPRSAGCWPRPGSRSIPTRDVELPPEDGETFEENALPKARAAAPRPAGRRSPTTRESSPRPWGARPACARRATRATRHRPGKPRQADARGARRERAYATCARWLTSPGDRRRSTSSSATARGRLAAEPQRGRAGSAMTLRSSPTRTRRIARWPSSPSSRRMRSAIAATRSGRSWSG